MKTLCIITSFLVLAISCGGSSHKSNSNNPQKETAACSISAEQVQNIESVFQTLSTKGTISGTAKVKIEGASADNISGQVMVTPQGTDAWQMTGKFCIVANQCKSLDTKVEIKNGCLLYGGKETN